MIFCISGSTVESVAVCAGSGVSVLSGCQADLWITGEMSHHEVLDVIHRRTSIILCEHSNTERGFLSAFKETLSRGFANKIDIIISKEDKDPLSIV